MRIKTSAGIAVALLALIITVRSTEAQQAGAWHVPPSVLEKYVGDYVYPDGNTVMVRLRGDTLYREIPGQLVPFVPLSNSLFKLGPVFTAEFVTDRDGGVTQILTDGIDIEFRLRRKTSGKAAPAPQPAASAGAAPVHVPRSVLERYVGRYDYVPGQMKRTDLFIVVRLKGDTLTREMASGREVVLTPINETRFKVGSTSLETEFVVDRAGGVTQIMGWGYQQMTAYRKPAR